MRKRRFISWLLTICLLLGMVPVSAYAEGNTSTITQDIPNQQGTMNITLTITGTLSDSNVMLSADSFTYNGSTQKPTVTVKHQRGTGTEVTLTENTDYTVAIAKDGSTITNPTDVGTYTVTVTGKGVYSGSGSKTYSITASTPDAPAAPTMASATKNSITLNEVDGCEYSKDGTTYQDSTEFTGLMPGTKYTFYQRVKATANTNVSSASSASFSTEADTYAMTITLTIKEIKVSAEDVSVAYDGQPHGITVNVTDPASDYTVKFGTTEGTYDLDASPTQTEKGSQTIYYQVTANNYVTKTGSATVTISEASAVAATVTANNRTYDGTEKPLVKVDKSTLVGGTMQYALGDVNGATQPYTTSIPTATNAGTYYVWYKVIGDKNHLDTEAESIKMKIDKAKGAFPKPANIYSWSSDEACVDAVDGQEYVIVEKGGEPDWTKAVTGNEEGSVIFEGLQPYTEYDVYTRVKETENTYAGEAVSTAFLTDLAGFSVEGDTYVGETLTITTDPEDAEELSYKWYYVNIVEEDEGYRRTELGDAIEGAEGATYTLTEDDYGKYVCVVIYRGDKEYDRSSEYGPVEYDPEKISYRNTEGAGGEWTKGSSDSLQMTFKRSVVDSETFDHFKGILVDGKAVDSSDYTAEAGSVIIKLNPSYLETLTVGEHVLTAQFDDADDAEADFTVKEAAEPAKDADIKPSDTQADTERTADEKIDSPKTGDETNPQLMLLIMLFAAVDMALVAFIKSKKKKN